MCLQLHIIYRARVWRFEHVILTFSLLQAPPSTLKVSQPLSHGVFWGLGIAHLKIYITIIRCVLNLSIRCWRCCGGIMYIMVNLQRCNTTVGLLFDDLTSHNPPSPVRTTHGDAR